MAKGIKLEDLVDAITSAFVTAQRRIQDYQISHILSYFDHEGRPKSLALRLPYYKQGELKEKEVSLPAIGLAPLSNLSIKEMEVSFEVQLGSLSTKKFCSDGDRDKRSAAAKKRSPEMKSVEVDITRGKRSQDGPMARVEIKMRGTKPNETVNRILDHLNKTV